MKNEMMKGKVSIILVVMLGLISGFAVSSCKKEKVTIAEIRVVDTNGQPVENAMVRLYGDPTIDVDREMVINDTLYTNREGTVIYNYSDRYNMGQSGFAVLNIEALSYPLVGEGIIKIEEEKTNKETVILQ